MITQTNENTFGIKDGYTPRLTPQYFVDTAGGCIYQPDVYTAAIELARKLGVRHIVDIGSGNGLKLSPVESEFTFIFVDFGENLQIIKNNMNDPAKHQFIHIDLENDFPILNKKLLGNSVVICSDVIEHMIDPSELAKGLKKCSDFAPLVFVSTPDRHRTYGVYQLGPPPNPAHTREWALGELNWYMRSHGMEYFASGYTRSNDQIPDRNTIIQISGSLMNHVLTMKDSCNMTVNIPRSKLSKALGNLISQYYSQNDLSSDDIQATSIELPVVGLLESVMPGVSVKQLLAHAISLNCGEVGVTLLEMQEKIQNYGQMNLNYKQPGKLLEFKGSSKIILGKNNGKIYPFGLMLVIPKNDHQSENTNNIQPQMVDGGFLEDDYILDIMSGIRQ